jgi:ATP-dependent Lon protease
MHPWNDADLTFDEKLFTGAARLFPLPDLVMFPHVMQPLHIFEPRYREMLQDALAGDSLIAMSILAPGWERDYEGRPAVLPQVCLTKVVAHQRLDNGRHNIMVLGMRRARLVHEGPAERSFRLADIELLDDVYGVQDPAERRAVQKALACRFQQALPLPKSGENKGVVNELLASDVPLGVLTDLVSFALPLESKLKVELLAECDVDRRAAMLMAALGSVRAADAPIRKSLPGGFPPKFSLN